MEIIYCDLRFFWYYFVVYVCVVVIIKIYYEYDLSCNYSIDIVEFWLIWFWNKILGFLEFFVLLIDNYIS